MRSKRRRSPPALLYGLLDLLVAAAQSGPTSSNLRAMSIVAVEDDRDHAIGERD